MSKANFHQAILGRVAYAKNAFVWPAWLRESGHVVGTVVAARVVEGEVRLTLEFFDGTIADKIPVEEVVLTPKDEDAVVAGVVVGTDFLVRPDGGPTNLRRVTWDPDPPPGRGVGITRIVKIDRATGEEVV